MVELLNASISDGDTSNSDVIEIQATPLAETHKTFPNAIYEAFAQEAALKQLIFETQRKIYRITNPAKEYERKPT